MVLSKVFSDIYYQPGSEKVFSFRSGNMVYEEVFSDGALTVGGWNASGYPLNVLANCNTRLDRCRYSEPYAFNIEIDGQSVDYDLEFTDFLVEERENTKDSTLILKSRIKPVIIKLHTLIDGTQMLSRWLEIENISDNYLNLSRLSVLSGGVESLDFNDLTQSRNLEEFYSIGYFNNDCWGCEGQFQWFKLLPYCTSIDSRFGRDRFRHPLLFIKNNLTGKIWFSQIGWSGGYRYTVDYNASTLRTTTHLSLKAEITGNNPILILNPGETYVSPTVYIGVVQGDIDDAVNEMHAHLRKSVLNMPEADGSEALINCGMGAEHDMSVETSKEYIRQFAKMGGEIFTVDAGWECPPGKEMEWGNYNGINIPDALRYPNGIKEVSDYAHSQGLKFGLWVDIESIGKECPLHEAKADWRSPNTFGIPSPKYLDLSIPEVAEWTESELARIITEYGLDLLRVDHNVDFTEYFAMRYTDSGRKECVNIRHTDAVYKMYENLKKRFPDVIFENCAGGGGRTDLGMMRYFNHSWVSDWQKAPRSVTITNGMTMALPPERVDRLFAGMGCHTTGSFDLHIRNTMLGHISLNVTSPAGAELNEAQMEFIRHSTDIYKSFIRPFLNNSNIYHHTEDLTNENCSILEIAAPDKSKGAVTVITLCNSGASETVVKLKGVDYSKNYKVTLDNERESFILSGRELKTNGIIIEIPSSLSSQLILYEVTE